MALLALAILIPAVYLGFTKSIPFQPHYEIKAAFESSNNLKKASPVRIAGVEVGKVTKVERVGRAARPCIVTMRVGKAGRPIHDDARAKIRPRIFLEGNFFVDLEPGTPGAPRSRRRRRSRSTRPPTPVQFDQVLTSLQSDTREDLKTLLDEYGNALDKGGAKAFNRSIPYWKSAYRDTAIVNEAMLGEAEHDLSGYVKSAGATAAALDRHPEQLKGLITDFNRPPARSPREEDDLRTAIAELPRTLRPPRPRWRAQRRLPAAARVRPRPAARRALLRAGARRRDAVRAPAARAGLRGRAARPRRRPAPTVPALARLTPRACRCSSRAALLASCQNEVVLPWTKDTVGDTEFPAEGPVYKESARGCRASPARAARVTPTGSGSACWRPAARTSAAGQARSADDTRSSASTRPSRRPARRCDRDGAVRDAGAAGPAQPPGAAAAAVARWTRARRRSRSATRRQGSRSTGSRASSSARASRTS